MQRLLIWLVSALALSWFAACTDDFEPQASGPSSGTTLPSGSSGTGATGGSGGAGGGGVNCGNDAIDEGETCDGSDLGTATCVTAGAFIGGTLACGGSCTLDTSGCIGPPASPRLRAPLNHAYVGSVHVPGSLRPVFRWDEVTVEGVRDPVRYEVIVTEDKALTVSVLEADAAVAALTLQPDVDLPVSEVVPVGAAYWWSVRACVGLPPPA